VDGGRPLAPPCRTPCRVPLLPRILMAMQPDMLQGQTTRYDTNPRLPSQLRRWLGARGCTAGGGRDNELLLIGHA
jgi:hypothetical protein